MTAGETIRDPEFMARAFQSLVEGQQEFSIQVKGAKTLPYTAVAHACDPADRTLLLRLFRPLPAALAAGARFEFTFATPEKRYEGQFDLQGREGYLQYAFAWPDRLRTSDRRVFKRYAFRPRENVYVTAQDNEEPCHGLTGPLVNLSQGGFCFRVDRMLRLEDGMPIRPRGGLFDRGRALAVVRIHGLDKEEVLESRGVVVRIQEEDSQVHLGIQFSDLGAAGRNLIQAALERREHQPGRGGSAPFRRPEGPRVNLGTGSGPLAAAGADAPAPEPATGPEPANAGLEPLRRLDRRAVPLLVVGPAGDNADALAGRLRAEGFWNLAAAPDLAAVPELLAVPGAPRLLVVDLQSGFGAGLEAVGAVRSVEPLLRDLGDLPVAFATGEPDPTLDFLARPHRAALAWADPEVGRPGAVLDRLLAGR